MRKLLFALFAFLLAAAPASAQTYSSPGAGTPERKAVLDALRPKIEAKLGRPVEFVVEEIRIGQGWAFVRVMPQRPGGREIENPVEDRDGVHTEAFLRRENGRWVVKEFGIGSTDVWWLSMCDSTPKGLIAQGCP